MKQYWKTVFWLGAVAAYFGQAFNMIASNIAGPASARQCAANPMWCFYYNHDWPAWLGAIMILLGFAAGITYLNRQGY